ncbi:MAG: hypothetical protein A2W22_04060 [Candidatus Levybacteria bacterium RBG_16_35_11]|nr:MAG: hypothetical protein A2W22_04060 [Candidatus Levybacteria bacterium RBG_16_35_11]
MYKLPMLESLSVFIIHLIQSTGYLGIFLLMLLSGVFIPIPTEITMPFSGFLASAGTFSLVLVILIGVLGDLVGSVIGYYIGYLLEESVLVNLIKKYGKYILVTEHEFYKARKWFDKYGSRVVFIGKLIPGVRTYIALPAGISEMSIWKFSSFVVLGTLVWSSFLAFAGFYLGKNWSTLGTYFRRFEIVIIIFLIVLVLVYLNHKLKIIKFKKS